MMHNFNIDNLNVTDIQTICQPLVDYFQIKSFSYVKIYPDMSRIHLDYNREWTHYFYLNMEKFIDDEKLTESHHWEPGFSTIYALDDPCCSDAAQFDIGDGLVIANRLEECTELTFIESSFSQPGNCLRNMLNHIDLLQQFILYFRDKASPIIQEAEKDPIVIPNLSLALEKPKKNFTLSLDEKRKLINLLHSYSITTREFECLHFLAQGLTSKEIGRALNIAPKTVDRHFENLKDKCHARNRIDLLKITSLAQGT